MIKSNIGILLVNLGTPDAPTPSAVRRFLKQFLSDPRVIDLPRLPWRLLLNLLILPLRAPKVAKNYQTIWLPEGAPLRVLTQRLADKLQSALSHEKQSNKFVVVGMQYGEPSIVNALLKLRKAGIEELIILPLYPQYSSTTTAAVFDTVSKAFRYCPALPAMHFIRDYHTHPRYISALAHSVRQHWASKGRGQQLVMAFHGIPKRYAKKR